MWKKKIVELGLGLVREEGGKGVVAGLFGVGNLEVVRTLGRHLILM